MKNCKHFILGTTLFLSATAFAQNSSKVSYQFKSEKITVNGVYSPEGNKKVNGLEAESLARSNGLKKAEEVFQSSCPQSLQDKTTVKLANVSEWRSQLKSLGSNIYDGGSLEIELSLPISSVLKNYKSIQSAKLKTADGKSIVFKVPSVSAEMVKCGKVDVQLAPGGDTVSVALQPSKDSGDKVEIGLKRSGQKLIIENSQNYSLLEPHLANLKSAGDIALPVTAR